MKEVPSARITRRISSTTTLIEATNELSGGLASVRCHITGRYSPSTTSAVGAPGSLASADSIILDFSIADRRMAASSAQ